MNLGEPNSDMQMQLDATRCIYCGHRAHLFSLREISRVTHGIYVGIVNRNCDFFYCVNPVQMVQHRLLEHFSKISFLVSYYLYISIVQNYQYFIFTRFLLKMAAI